MELKEFSNLVVKDEIAARNFMSFLIGNLRSNDDVGKALLGFYESLDDQIKKHDDAFSSVMLKYFFSYKINDNNFYLYQKFENYFKNNDKEGIKELNPHWIWDKTTYKNSLEFSKALWSTKNKEVFIEKNDDEIQKLLKKNKAKFVENLMKQNIFKDLTRNNYTCFEKFVEKYDIDKEDILKKLYGKESSYGVKELLGITDLELHPLIKKLIKGETNIFDGSELFEKSKDPYQDQLSMVGLALNLIYMEKYEDAFNLIEKYEMNINTRMKDYIYDIKNDETIDCKQSKYWNKLIKILNEKTSHYNRDKTISVPLYNLNIKIEEFFQLAEKIKLKSTLETMSISDHKTNKNKI